MILSGEALLALGIIGFYLFDCLRMTSPDRFYFTYATGHWDFQLPKRIFRFGQKSLDILNPLTPWRLAWRSDLHLSVNARDTLVGRKFLRAIDAIVPLQMTLALIVLLLMPAAILINGLGDVFLGLLVIMYLLLLVILRNVWQRRKDLQLTRAQFLTLAAECILCVPLGINLIRKLVALRADIGDAPSFARRNLKPTVLVRWRSQMGAYVRDQQMWYAPDDDMYHEWERMFQRISGRKS